MAALAVDSFDKRLNALTVGKDKAGHYQKVTSPPATAEFFAEQTKDRLPTAPLLTSADAQF